MARPSIFIVGAPKCGTTALYHCLRQHPALYFPLAEHREAYWLFKEPGHFAGDLKIADWLRVIPEEDYLRLFEPAAEGRLCGEATATYLFSEEAPQRIRTFTGGEAKIIIMVRSPVLWMRSWHHDLLRYGYENCGDFEKAIERGERRDAGRELPRRAAFAGCMNYRKLAHFSEYVHRWQETFGQERVFIGWQPDFEGNPQAFLRRLLDFLGVDPGPMPEAKRENDSSVLPATHAFDLWLGRVMGRLPGGEPISRFLQAEVGGIYRGVVDRVLRPLSDRTIAEPLLSRLQEEFSGEETRLMEMAGAMGQMASKIAAVMM
ncbi:hypothetical protein HNR46_000629 [Haloferula luteola]|uniref:Sulfotransferase domain-containing protein n=1 Tax=Haloferula luteola TaxID=595692 RepID=A0A840UXF1_9BACT|nr:sulfotransferase [Haloferula luteola]MBB5350405.1 hypothetical protein [Haloferula luteola]